MPIFPKFCILHSLSQTYNEKSFLSSFRYKPEVEGPKSWDGNMPVKKAIQGERLTLFCKYDANPRIGTVVTWYRDGRPVDYGGHYEKVRPFIFSGPFN